MELFDSLHIILVLTGNGQFQREITPPYKYLSHFSMGTSLNGKNLLPLGANSIL